MKELAVKHLRIKMTVIRCIDDGLDLKWKRHLIFKCRFFVEKYRKFFTEWTDYRRKSGLIPNINLT
jgi:hypothetical protein